MPKWISSKYSMSERVKSEKIYQVKRVIIMFSQLAYWKNLVNIDLVRRYNFKQTLSIRLEGGFTTIRPSRINDRVWIMTGSDRKIVTNCEENAAWLYLDHHNCP